MGSHYRRHAEEKKKSTLLYSIIGSLLLILFIIFYGIPLFTKYVLYLGNTKKSGDVSSQDQSSISYVAPPVLDNTFSATNSASVLISGIAEKNQTIRLYVNNEETGEQTTNEEGKFRFNNVTLDPGSNNITAKSFTSNDKQSDYSNTITISYFNKGPNLDVSVPTDNQSVSGSSNQTLHIQGVTDASSHVTINGSWVIVNGNGSFTYDFPLQNGDNDIKIIATDPAGNTTTVERHVTFSQ